MLEQIPKGSKIIFDTMIQFLSEEIQGVAKEKSQREIAVALKRCIFDPISVMPK